MEILEISLVWLLIWFAWRAASFFSLGFPSIFFFFFSRLQTFAADSGPGRCRHRWLKQTQCRRNDDICTSVDRRTPQRSHPYRHPLPLQGYPSTLNRHFSAQLYNFVCVFYSIFVFFRFSYLLCLCGNAHWVFLRSWTLIHNWLALL